MAIESGPSTVQDSDSVLRAMTDDGAFRVITAHTTQTVRGIFEAQKPATGLTRTFADLITGAILIRETMAPQLRVQAILKRPAERASLIADSNPTGDTRGLISMPGGATEFSVEGSVLQLMRTMHNGQIHQGMVEVPPGGEVSRALMFYMQASEQITTMIATSAIFEDGQVVCAGGYLVQLLPEVDRGPLAIMAERLEDYRNIDELLKQPEFTPLTLLEELLYLMPFTQVGDSGIRSACWCSRTRVITALSTLPRGEVEDIIQEGRVLEISCDYCHREFGVAPSELQGLLQKS